MQSGFLTTGPPGKSSLCILNRCRFSSFKHFFFGRVTGLVGSQFLDQGLNSSPLQCKCRVLTTTLPGGSRGFSSVPTSPLVWIPSTNDPSTAQWFTGPPFQMQFSPIHVWSPSFLFCSMSLFYCSCNNTMLLKNYYTFVIGLNIW